MEGDIQLEGANASAEEADEGTDVNAVSGVDIVLNHRLQETGTLYKHGDSKGGSSVIRSRASL